MIVLDTNVLSEVMKPVPAIEVLAWLRSHSRTTLFITAITQAEILYGLELLPKGKRRDTLHSAATIMFEDRFADRILAFDSEAARLYPMVAMARRTAGRPISLLDAQIAAIVRSRGGALATRNITDFEGCGVRIFNPWQ